MCVRECECECECVCACVCLCVCVTSYIHTHVLYLHKNTHVCTYVMQFKAGNLMGDEFVTRGRTSAPAGLEVRDQGEEEEWDYHWDPTREAEEDMLQAKFVKFL